MNSAIVYIPPLFNLFEIDDPDVPSADSAARWLPGWQGLSSEPAQEVSLGWFDNEGHQAVVSTSAWPPDSQHEGDDRDAKTTMARIVFAGTQIEGIDRPTDPRAVFKKIDQVASTEWPWQPADIYLDERPFPGRTTQIATGVVGGYAIVQDRLVAFAATELPLAAIRFRTVTGANASNYAVDPTQPQGVDSLGLQPTPSRNT